MKEPCICEPYGEPDVSHYSWVEGCPVHTKHPALKVLEVSGRMHVEEIAYALKVPVWQASAYVVGLELRGLVERDWRGVALVEAL